MKKILVPTDFSANADNAIDFAIEFAQALELEITFLHTYQVQSTAGMFISVEAFMKKDAANQMLPSYEKASSRLGKKRVESKIIRGNTISVIANMADKEDYDLILMGTQGASSLAEIFAGTVTSGVIQKSKTPVLAIPEGYKFQGIHNIVLAIDQKGPSLFDILSPLLKIIEKTQAHLFIFHQNVEEEIQGIEGVVDQYFNAVEHSFHYDLDKEDINQSINKFVSDYQAQILCMIKHNRSFIEGIFHLSATKTEVFNSPVPLLVLKD